MPWVLLGSWWVIQKKTTKHKHLGFYGRADYPKGERLKPYLDLYGKIGAKYFYELCRNWEKESTDEDFIKDNVGKLSKDNQKLIKAMMETMLAKK